MFLCVYESVYISPHSDFEMLFQLKSYSRLNKCTPSTKLFSRWQYGMWNDREQKEFGIDQRTESMGLRDDGDVNLCSQRISQNIGSLDLDAALLQEGEGLNLKEASEVTDMLENVGDFTHSYGSISNEYEGLSKVVTNVKAMSSRYPSSDTSFKVSKGGERDKNDGKGSEDVKRYLGETSSYVLEGDMRHGLPMESHFKSHDVGSSKQNAKSSVDVDANTEFHYEDDFE